MLELDAVIAEGEWPGSRTQLIDTTGFGKYLLEVIDPSSNRVLYSRGFATIYGEWETTPEFRAKARTFHESVRFPRPNAPVRVAIKARDRQNVFRPLWERDVDPRAVPRLRSGQTHAFRRLFENGPPSRAVDLLLISAGYSSAEAPKFRADAERLLNALFTLEPFKSRRADFNVRALHVPASPVPVEFNIFGLERYALTYDNRALRETARGPPHPTMSSKSW